MVNYGWIFYSDQAQPRRRRLGVLCRFPADCGTADGGGQTRPRHLAAAASGTTGTWILCGVYVIVSSILLYLLVISRGWMGKFYLGFCTVSASSTLLRTAEGAIKRFSRRHL
jgi:hypothetical protein